MAQEAIAVVDQIQYVQERRDRIMQGKPADVAGADHTMQGSREILQIGKPHAIQLEDGSAIGPSGSHL
jgi:hypothetical protein